MKIARFREGRRVAYGVIEGDEVCEIRGSIFSRFRVTDNRFKLDDVRLLAPTDPMQMWCPGLNFADHLEFAASVLGPEASQAPQEPQPWHKGRNSLIGPEDTVVIPRDSQGEVHYEGELVAVIGRTCRRATPQNAMKHVLGYTCGNDISERTWQASDNTFWRAKGTDTFAPVGPWIETEVDPGHLDMMVRLNGKEVQRANTKDMIHNFAEIICCISQAVTLHPGDLIFSGTTGTTTVMKNEDVVEVDIPGVGVLRNPVTVEL